MVIHVLRVLAIGVTRVYPRGHVHVLLLVAQCALLYLLFHDSMSCHGESRHDIMSSGCCCSDHTCCYLDTRYAVYKSNTVYVMRMGVRMLVWEACTGLPFPTTQWYE